jgi:hypothetical protein
MNTQWPSQLYRPAKNFDKLKNNLEAKTAVDRLDRQSSAKGKGVAHVNRKRESPDCAG